MRPTPRCVLLFAAGIGVALLPALLGPRLWPAWAVYVGLCLLLAGADLVLAPARRAVAVDVEVPRQLLIGTGGEVRLRLRAPRALPTRVRVLADLSPDLRPQPARHVLVGGGTEGEVAVPLLPARRGLVRVEALWLRWTGPLGLVERVRHLPRGDEIAVVPDVGAVRAVALRLFAERQFRSGLKVERYVGDGTEFESLREYVPGLDARAIHWKATARHRTLLCQDFRAERNHQIVLAFDTGRLMSEPLAGIPKLDHAINAGLVLAWVCLRTGDRVGGFAFDERPRAWSRPDAGPGAFARFQHLTARMAYTDAETNFTLGLTDLSTRLRRRSLVVVLTDLVDTVSAELMVENVARLSRRHLVLFVALRDAHLDETAGGAPTSLAALHRAVVTADLVRERDLVLRRLRRIGVHTIDAPPHAVSTRLLNHYLDVKRRELV